MLQIHSSGRPLTHKIVTTVITLKHLGILWHIVDEKRYNWRHDSILLSLASMVPRNVSTRVYADIPGFTSPSVVTGEEQRPDIVINMNNSLWIIELTVGFETNVRKNYERKLKNYEQLISDLKKRYSKVIYVNLSMGACGIIGKESKLKQFLNQFDLPPSDIAYHIAKIMNICVRTTYYIFCRRNQDWLNPELMSW